MTSTRKLFSGKGSRLLLMGLGVPALLATLTIGMGNVQAAQAVQPAKPVPHVKALHKGSYPIGHKPKDMKVCDLNGDGKPDIVTTDIDENEVNVLINKGDGTFNATVNYEVGFAPYGVTLADVNGDGKTDIVTSNYGDLFHPGSVSVLINKGNGTFNAASVFRNDYAYMTVSGDFNSDGKADVVVSNWTRSVVTLFAGKGDGTFNDGNTVDACNQASDMTVGDFNGDKKLDLAVKCEGAGQVTILYGNGQGGFAKGPALSVPGTGALTTCDLNRDGLADIAVVSNTVLAHQLKIFLNDGKGGFTNNANYDYKSIIHYPVIADIDSSGNPAILVADDLGNKVQLYTGAGDGTFVAGPVYQTDTRPQELDVDDFNGDGKPDLAVMNWGVVGFPGSVTVNMGTGWAGSATMPTPAPVTPTAVPTMQPTAMPTVAPTTMPTVMPTAVPTTPTTSIDLALGKPVMSSSAEGKFPVVNIVDGDPNSRWSSCNQIAAWVRVDLQSAQKISRIKLSWFNDSYATAYTIQVSDDLVHWTNAYQTTNGHGGVSGIEDITGLSTSGRYVRVSMATANSKNYSIWKLEIFN